MGVLAIPAAELLPELTNSDMDGTPLAIRDDKDWLIVDATTGNWSAFCIKDFDPTAGNGKKAVTTEISVGIEYLRGVPGQPLELHRGCGQVSCSWNSAIYWCNEEKDHGLRLKQYGDIADGAKAVIDKCAKGAGVVGKAVTGWDFVIPVGGKAEGEGKSFDPEGKSWSVVVVGGKC